MNFPFIQTAAATAVSLWLMGIGPAQVSNQTDATTYRGSASINCPIHPVFNVEEYRAHYEQAVKKARIWLDQLKVDPLELRAHGVKGKKKLAEILDIYFRLYGAAGPEKKKNILTRVKTLTIVTGQTNYHDMLVVNDLEFKQDATSYLRVAYLMERFGLDTVFYRQQIQKVHRRLNEHMVSRGVDQRMAFHWYYEHFSLKEPFPLESAFQTGLIKARKPAAWFKENQMEAYNLTHEVFVPYKFGEELNADFFSSADKTYLRGIFKQLVPWYIERRDIDLLAEFVLCAIYLKMTNMAVYHDGVNFLLESQNADGSWGEYERHRAAMGAYIEQGLYLHTTMVALDALVMAFETER